MKKSSTTLGVLIAILTISCENAAEKQKAREQQLHQEITGIIKNYFLKSLEEIGDGDALDTVEVYRIDTLTAKKDSIIQSARLLATIQSKVERIKKQQRLVQLNIDQASLTRNLSKDLFEISKRDAQDEIDKSKEMLEEVNRLNTRLKHIDSLVNHGQIDSVTQTGYVAYFNDVTQSATLLASHRAGGFHRLMHSVAARTSYIKRFCKIPVLELRSDRNFAKPPAR